MPLIPYTAVFQKKLATLPLATYQAGETGLVAASATGRLLILKQGEVAVIKEGVEIAKVTEPGAVFGELSVLLERPHTADVRRCSGDRGKTLKDDLRREEEINMSVSCS
jgi:CRP/FNR family cyclic AMP-dependent transcriptional regulator